MYLCDSLPSDLRTHFMSADGFGNLEFVTEFPVTKRKIPLTKLIVSFGIESVKITQPADEDGARVYDSYHECETVGRFVIHGARDTGGADIYLAFSRITEEIFDNFSADVDEISCGGLAYDTGCVKI